MKTIIALSGQTLFDIALQEMGSIEGVFDILDANAFLRLDMAIASGTKVLVPDKIINSAVLDYYTRNNIKPVSGIGEEISITQQDMIQIKQVVDYDLADGDNSFEGVRLANLGDELSVQINYADLAGMWAYMLSSRSTELTIRPSSEQPSSSMRLLPHIPLTFPAW